jgi:hypothetical protein
MTKGELAQLKLRSKATTGIEKFNIPTNTPVQYEVTLLTFEKVRHNSTDERLFFLFYSRRKKLGR